MKSSIAANAIFLIAVNTITGLVSVTLAAFGVKEQRALSAWLICLLCSLLLIILFRDRISSFALRVLGKLIGSPLQESLGLAGYYSSCQAAEREIVRRFKTAREIRIMLQLGRDVIGATGKSLLYDAIQDRRQDGWRMKLMLIDLASKHLSPERARARESKHSEWRTAANFTYGSARSLQSSGLQVECRLHTQPYLWRLFFIDDRLFVIPYLYEKKNSSLAPCLEFYNPGSSEPSRASFFSVFSIYFEHIWQSAEPLKPEREAEPQHTVAKE